MKIATYLMLGVVAIFIIFVVVSVVIAAAQILSLMLAVYAAMFIILKVATYFRSRSNKPPS